MIKESLRLFTSQEDFDNMYYDSDYDQGPRWFSAIRLNNDYENPILNYEKDYLTFEITGNGNIEWKESVSGANLQKKIEYRKNYSGSWIEITSSYDSPTSFLVENGDIIEFRANNERYSDTSSPTQKYCSFSGSATFKASGNLLSLISKYNFESLTLLAPYAFTGLFEHSSITDASKLKLPNFVSTGCYEAMFADCYSLLYSPILGASTLTTDCYKRMFCQSDIIYIKCFAESIPSTSITDWVYNCDHNDLYLEVNPETEVSYGVHLLLGHKTNGRII